MGWQSTVWAPTVWAAGVWVCDSATPTPRPYPGPAGRGKRQGKRKKWVIDGQQIIATPDEIEEYFEARLERERAPEREEPEEVEAAEVEAPKAPTRDRAIGSSPRERAHRVVAMFGVPIDVAASYGGLAAPAFE